jgi:hypothetical protein
MKHSIVRETLSIVLMLAITFVTVPLLAKDLPTASRMIGSVGAVGQVDLRGVTISGDGTLFSGDRIQVHKKGYAKVLVGAGSKVELFENSDVNIQQDSKEIKIAMNGGMVGFTANTPVRVNLASFEVTGKDNASANVAITSPTTAGVRAVSGDVTVRSLKTSESYRLTKGQTRLLSLKDGLSTTSIGEMASAAPGAVPAPAIPSAKTPKPAKRGLSLDTGGWLALVGAVAGGAVAITALVIANDNGEEIDALEGKVDSLTATNAANNAAVSAQLTLISNLSAIANTNAQLQSQMASTQALAGQAQLALSNVSAADAATASKISVDASASQVRLNSLASQISTLQAQLVRGQGSSAQLTVLLQQEEAERAISNKLAADLNALLLKNKNVNGVPQGTVGTVNPPTQASASIPL